MTVGKGAASRIGALPWLGALGVVYLAVPIAVFVLVAARGSTPWRSPGLWGAVTVSAATATISTVVAAVVGVPLAYALARRRGQWWARAGSVAVLLPLAVPPLVSGIVLVEAAGPATPIGRLFGGHLTDSMAGIVLAQTFVSMPFAIVAARSGFEAVDDSVLDVAATLGLAPWQRFLQVALVAARPAVVAGLLLTWLRAFGEFGASVVMAYHPYSLPVLTFVRFSGYGLAQARAPAVLALGVAAAVVAVARADAAPPRSKNARPAPPPARPAPRYVPGPRRLRFAVEHRVGDLDLRVHHLDGQPRLAVLGPSGAGKTTVLRCLAGFVGEDVEVEVDGRSLGELPPERRAIGYVPQDAGLVPGIRVAAQLRLGLGRAADARASLAYWSARCGLEGLEHRLPHELSGGQRRRVALARALCRDPVLLLLDEPFAGLDRPVAEELAILVRDVQRQHAMASIVVTHDPRHAARLADEVVVLVGGVAAQSGPFDEVLARPARPEVAGFLGVANVHRATFTDAATLEVGGGLSLVPGVATGLEPGAAALWRIAPEHVRLGADGGAIGTVEDVVPVADGAEVRVSLPGVGSIVARAATGRAPALGAPCSVGLPSQHVTAWPSGELASGADRRVSAAV